MRAEEVRQAVFQILADVAPEADMTELQPDVNFRDQIEMDSVDYLALMLGLEDRLGITIPETDYPKLSSLGGCLDYLAD